MRLAVRRALVAAGALCLLAACEREPDFDERYSAAEKTIREKAAEIDRDLAEGGRIAAEDAGADPAVGEAGGDAAQVPTT